MIDSDDPSTWEPAMLRCPRCNRVVLPDRADQHVADHFLLRIGDYVTRDLDVVESRREAHGIYVGNGRAKFFDETLMRFVGMHRRQKEGTP